MNEAPLDFAADVIERSRQTPVLVDFWAPWCGPCKALAPVLEKLAGEEGVRWSLVKVNTDVEQDLAGRFGIRGIPNLKLFHHGQVIAELAGALPEPQLRAWLAQHLPTPKRESMRQARTHLLAGRSAQAAALLLPLAAAEPADAELAVLTARAVAFRDPVDALRRIDHLPPASPWQDEAQVVRLLAGAVESGQSAEGRLPASPERDRYVAALADLRSERFREALATLVELLGDRPDLDGGRAQSAALSIFKHLGIRHPVAEEFHRAYSMAVNR